MRDKLDCGCSHDGTRWKECEAHAAETRQHRSTAFADYLRTVPLPDRVLLGTTPAELDWLS